MLDGCSAMRSRGKGEGDMKFEHGLHFWRFDRGSPDIDWTGRLGIPIVFYLSLLFVW
jgi:hypothetical protein